MERQLATIQKIAKLTPIPDADNIETAHILGWTVVVKKGEFKENDLIVYCEIDSVLPEHPEFEFLRKSSWVDNGVVRGFRIKTVRLRKQLSQGIIFPTTILKTCQAPLFEDLRSLEAMMWKQLQSGTRTDEKFIDTDVTDALHITKYERPVPAQLAGQIKGDFPQKLMPKTDEIRIQSIPHILQEHAGIECVVTEKLDGTSCTFYFDKKTDTFGVCSRNLDLKTSDLSTEYMKMAIELDIEARIRRMNQSVCIQGEIIGPGIQNNKYNLRKPEFYAFNVYMIDARHYLSYHSMQEFLRLISAGHAPQIQSVPLLTRIWLNHTLQDLLTLAEGPSVINGDQTREGIVVRPVFEDTNDTPNAKGEKLGRLSFKVISNKFLETSED